MTTAALMMVGASQIMFAGFFLGIGFWGSKKLTNQIDLRFALRKSNIKQLTKEFPYEESNSPA